MQKKKIQKHTCVLKEDTTSGNAGAANKNQMHRGCSTPLAVEHVYRQVELKPWPRVEHLVQHSKLRLQHVRAGKEQMDMGQAWWKSKTQLRAFSTEARHLRVAHTNRAGWLQKHGSGQQPISFE